MSTGMMVNEPFKYLVTAAGDNGVSTFKRLALGPSLYGVASVTQTP